MNVSMRILKRQKGFFDIEISVFLFLGFILTMKNPFEYFKHFSIQSPLIGDREVGMSGV